MNDASTAPAASHTFAIASDPEASPVPRVACAAYDVACKALLKDLADVASGEATTGLLGHELRLRLMGLRGVTFD